MNTSQFTYDQLSFLQSLPIALVAAIARGDIDVQQMAREELAARGVDENGAWVGFAAASRIHGVSQ